MTTSSQAQPISMKQDTTLLTHPPANYHFTSHEITSADHQHRYQLFIGLPAGKAPESGFSVIYALDGNAVISRLSAAQLQQLSHPPVIVAIGYPTDDMFDGNARTFDYTPARAAGDTVDPVHGRPAGGAELFTQVIASQIKPYIESLTTIDHQHQYLWGHSYGGLFVLNTYFRHQHLFNYYISASPSLWWQNGVILDTARAYLADQPVQSAPLWILRGSDESKENRKDPAAMSEDYKKMLAARTALPDNAGSQFFEDLKQAGIPVQQKIFDGLNHGRMFPAALTQALHIISQSDKQPR